MDSLESLDIKGAAQYLQKSERTLRRYLQAGKLEHSKEPLPAGGFRYLISQQSLELLRSELDTGKGRHAGLDMSGLDGLPAQVQGLQELVQAQAEQIGQLSALVERLSLQLEQVIPALPPAPEEREKLEQLQQQRRSPWWRRLLR
jgi:hypothetical protein